VTHYACFALYFSRMKRGPIQGSVAGDVRERVTGASGGTFFRKSDFAGSPRAVETALGRLAAEGELVRVRHGLYWRGTMTRFGMTGVSALDVALAVAGPGAGPAGTSAAQMLGLTTQVPATIEVAVPGVVPRPLHGVRFRSRPFTRRERRLTPLEVAFIEVLRDPTASETGWDETGLTMAALLAGHRVRPEILAEEVATEHHRQARDRWASIPA